MLEIDPKQIADHEEIKIDEVKFMPKFDKLIDIKKGHELYENFMKFNDVLSRIHQARRYTFTASTKSYLSFKRKDLMLVFKDEEIEEMKYNEKIEKN